MLVSWILTIPRAKSSKEAQICCLQSQHLEHPGREFGKTQSPFPSMDSAVLGGLFSGAEVTEAVCGCDGPTEYQASCFIPILWPLFLYHTGIAQRASCLTPYGLLIWPLLCPSSPPCHHQSLTGGNRPSHCGDGLPSLSSGSLGLWDFGSYSKWSTCECFRSSEPQVLVKQPWEAAAFNRWLELEQFLEWQLYRFPGMWA